MKKTLHTILSLAFLTLTFCTAFGQIGTVEITELKGYNKEDSFIPHDCSIESLVPFEPVEIRKGENEIEIENTWNSGFTGHRISFLLNNELELLTADYFDWADVVDGTEMTFNVDSVEIKLSANPFETEVLTGRYVAFLTVIYEGGSTLDIYGTNKKVKKRQFKGKFRTCEKK